MKPYHHGNLRQELVSTAVGLAREKGPDGVVLREVGKAYVHFALEEPGLFAVAFSCQLPEDPSPSNPYAVLGRALDEMVETGAMAEERRPGAEVVCWSAVHGFALLHLDGPLRVMPEKERERQLDQMLEAVQLGLR
jgi:hypothetical protein